MQATRRSLRGAHFKESHFPPLALLLAISEILANTLSIMSKEYRPDCSAFIHIRYKRKMNLKTHLNLKSFRASKLLDSNIQFHEWLRQLNWNREWNKVETVGYPDKPKTVAKSVYDVG